MQAYVERGMGGERTAVVVVTVTVELLVTVAAVEVTAGGVTCFRSQHCKQCGGRWYSEGISPLWSVW